MPVSATTRATYAPWGNAELTFELPTGTVSTDTTTGNAGQPTQSVSYLVALSLDPPDWTGQPGADQTVYRCRGRLLSPSTLDPRITNGSQAQAVINGVVGRFELVFDLAMVAFHRSDLRQTIQGTFRVIGGGV